MRKILTYFVCLVALLTSSGCLIKADPKPTYSELQVTRGDLVVISFTSDSLLVFDSNGTFKKVLYQLANTSDSSTGISWLGETNEVLIAIDGTPDRIEAINSIDGSVRNFYLNTTYLTGTPLALTVLKDTGDVLASEGATIERFASNGIRETWTTIWPTNVHANSQQLVALSTGNWLSCSSTQGVRIYPDSTTALASVATVTSAIAATTISYGCSELSDGTIVVAWNGTSDAIQTYSSTLTSPTTIISNPAVLSDPRGIAVGENDEIYVAEGTRNVIVQIDKDGNVIKEFGNSYLQSPRAMIVVPAFN